MTFIDFKVFLVPPVLERDLTNQSVKFVISLSQFVERAGRKTWHGQRCNLFCFAPTLLPQMVRPAAVEQTLTGETVSVLPQPCFGSGMLHRELVSCARGTKTV